MVNALSINPVFKDSDEMANKMHTSEVLKALQITYKTLDKWCKNKKIKKWKWSEAAGFKFREYDPAEIMKIKAQMPRKRLRGFPLIDPNK